MAAHRLINGPLIKSRKWFRAKMGIGRGRRKRTMQLSGAPTQQLRRRQIRADSFLRKVRQYFVAQSDEMGLRNRRLLDVSVRNDQFKIMIQTVECVSARRRLDSGQTCRIKA